MSDPRVPLTPLSLPQQRIYEVKTMRATSSKAAWFVGYPGSLTEMVLPRRRSRDSIYVCQVEWASSPWHNRLDAYHLSRSRKHWLLWLGGLQDDVAPWRWNWDVVAGIEARGLNAHVAAMSLLEAFWTFDRSEGDVRRFSWINDEALLSVADIEAVAREVWAL